MEWHRSENHITEEWLTDLAMFTWTSKDSGEEKVAACRYVKVYPFGRRMRRLLPSQRVGERRRSGRQRDTGLCNPATLEQAQQTPIFLWPEHGWRR